MRGIEGKYVLVTGAGKGIGAAIAARFIEEEAAAVILLDYDEKLARETAGKLDESGERSMALQCDVTDAAQVKGAVRKILERFGRVDILVNNAGITLDKIFHRMDSELWHNVLDVNLNGPFYMCHELVPLMREQQFGRIINIASTSAFGNTGQANYAASKAGLIGFTKTLAKECAVKGITVNAVAPGGIDTDMFAEVPEPKKEEFLSKIPARRLGKPEEVAGVVCFLASADAAYVNGQCIVISGGADT